MITSCNSLTYWKNYQNHKKTKTILHLSDTMKTDQRKPQCSARISPPGTTPYPNAKWRLSGNGLEGRAPIVLEISLLVALIKTESSGADEEERDQCSLHW